MRNAKRHSIVDIGYWTCDIEADARSIHNLVVEGHEPNKDLDLPASHATMDLRQNITAAACDSWGDRITLTPFGAYTRHPVNLLWLIPTGQILG